MIDFFAGVLVGFLLAVLVSIGLGRRLAKVNRALSRAMGDDPHAA